MLPSDTPSTAARKPRAPRKPRAAHRAPVGETPIYEQLVGELLIDPVKLSAEIKAGIEAKPEAKA